MIVFISLKRPLDDGYVHRRRVPEFTILERDKFPKGIGPPDTIEV
jgi:hypothetical protein